MKDTTVLGRGEHVEAREFRVTVQGRAFTVPVGHILNPTGAPVRIQVQKHLVKKGDEEVLMLLRREQVLEETIA